MTVQVRNRCKKQTWLSILPRCTVALGLLVSLALVPTQALAATFVVHAGAGCTDPTVDPPVVVVPTHATIQAAVMAALGNADDVNVIKVCPGDYPENIEIDEGVTVTLFADKDLTIEGLGFTPVPPMMGPMGLRDKTQVRILGAGLPGPIINVISADRVDIKYLTVDGESAMVPGPTGKVVGIQYKLVDGLMHHVAVMNIASADPTVVGIGIAAQGLTTTLLPFNLPALSWIQVLQSMVKNASRLGIKADGQGIRLSVDQTRVVGPPMLNGHAPIGIQVARGAKGYLSGNELSDFRSPSPTTGAASAILFTCPMPPVADNPSALAQSNTILNADLGIAVIDADGVVIGQNTIIDTDIGITMQAQGTFFFANPMCFIPLTPPQNLLVVSNTIIDATEAGIQSTTFNPNGTVPQDSNIQDNTIDTMDSFEMAPIAVSSGQRLRFIENIIWGGPSSRIVDVSTTRDLNTYGNFCFGITINEFCNPLTPSAKGLIADAFVGPGNPAANY